MTIKPPKGAAPPPKAPTGRAFAPTASAPQRPQARGEGPGGAPRPTGALAQPPARRPEGARRPAAPRPPAGPGAGRTTSAPNAVAAPPRPAAPRPPAPPPRPRLPSREDFERQCEVEFFVASGPGGQHRNKTETGVRVRHLPTGLLATATERRSQHQNKEAAHERLWQKLVALCTPVAPRKKTRVPAGAKRRRLQDKRVTSARKADRRKPGRDD